MYQILINTTDGRNFMAANVSAKEAGFIKDDFRFDGGFTRFDVEVYDERVSARSYEDYGRFLPKKAMLEWLYKNVFKHDYKNTGAFLQHYQEELDEYLEGERIKNLCLDILYNDYTAGCSSEKVYDRLYPYIISCITEDHKQRPGKEYLRRAIRRAFVGHTIYNHRES